MNKVDEQAERLMGFLLKNKEDRGVMADLRCGFSEARQHRAWPHIAPYCKLDVEWSRLPVQTVCAAFASQPESTKAGNLGSTLRRLKEAMASAEGRFERLLTCDTKEELCTRLPAIIRAAKAKGIPVNYQQLYCDICWWEVADIKVRWAAAFWGTGGGDA